MSARLGRWTAVAAAIAWGALVLAGCTSAAGGPDSSPTRSTPSSPTPPSARDTLPNPPAPTHPSSSTRPHPRESSTSTSTAQRALAAMSLRERVGQLIMIDCPSGDVPSATIAAIRGDQVGSVILDGTSYGGVQATAHVTASLRALAPAGVGLFIATDQEGGEVQRLQGPGFDRIPSGLDQGRLDPDTLRADAKAWGAQLRNAGVNVNLAPVLDTVPAGGGPNPPIGDLDREYGHTPDAVGSHGVAFLRGMADAGVDATAKHFPGLGRVTGNTDTASGVLDDTTTANDPYLAPYRAAIKAGVPFVMMSTAIYPQLDPDGPAAFSKKIVTDLLRDRLGFTGVVISDDLGAAKQVSGYSPGQRAVDFVAAGGDMALSVAASDAAPMTAALVARAQQDPAFRKLVDAAALRVLRAKQARGLLG